MGGDGCEDISTGERRPWCGQVVVRVRELNSTGRSADHGYCGRQETVVGTNKDRLAALADFHRYGSAAGRHPWVDDGEHDPGRQVLHGPNQGQTAGPDVVWWHFVADVDHGDMRGNAADHRVDHADKLIGQPVVRKEGDG